MYLSFFGLKERPFSIAPDPRYLFMSQRHKEALAHLAYGIRHGAGFVLLTGEVGTGKTTICRQILRKLPSDTRLAFILNPMLNALELLATLCDELGIDYDRQQVSLKQLTDNLTRFLLQCHQDSINVVLMIDEAQNLAPEVLEQIRLLTNLETDQRKLLQIILVGQPELQELLARKDLRQLAQRVTARYHLRPLNEEETRAYILHRLRIAGATHPLLTKQAIRAIYLHSEGIPRLINNLCDRAMMAAFTAEHKQVGAKHVALAAKEAMPIESQEKAHPLTLVPRWMQVSALMLVLAIGFFIGQLNVDSAPQASTIPLSPTRSSPKMLSNGSENQPEASAQHVWSNRNQLFHEVVGTNAMDASGVQANKVLASRWALDYDDIIHGDFCHYVSDYRLKCQEGFDSWDNLLELNRPANLLIEDSEGHSSWITLHRVQDDRVEIESINGRRWIEKDWLLALWSREYRLLWQAPPGYSRALKLGDSGADVDWLVERIAFVYQDPSIKERTSFDDLLQQKVIDFQRRHGLKSDGIAGMNTLMKLNLSTTQGIPRLR
jgi:general secretion pathway protein A